MAANRDVSIFGLDANNHNPERNLPSDVPPYGLSFGKGMHACIGINLAAGVVPKKDSDPTTHQYGIITLIAKKLLEKGVSPDKITLVLLIRVQSETTGLLIPFFLDFRL